MSLLDLGPDELLTTTRAVRRRLDLDRPVPQSLIRECIEIAVQGPTGGNTQSWHFVVVADADKRAALAEIYRRAWALYEKAPGSVYDLHTKEPESPRKAQLGRVVESADYLVDNLHRVPFLLIPCIGGRVNLMIGEYASVGLASVFGSILPATWNYMLAARARGLGTVWTTCHLMFEREAADILQIPYDEISQVAMIPTAYSIGTDFKPALRKPLDDVLHIDQW